MTPQAAKAWLNKPEGEQGAPALPSPERVWAAALLDQELRRRRRMARPFLFARAVVQAGALSLAAWALYTAAPLLANWP